CASSGANCCNPTGGERTIAPNLAAQSAETANPAGTPLQRFEADRGASVQLRYLCPRTARGCGGAAISCETKLAGDKEHDRLLVKTRLREPRRSWPVGPEGARSLKIR